MQPKGKKMTTIQEDLDTGKVVFNAPPWPVKEPPAHVQTVGDRPSANFSNYYKAEELRQLETVAACIILEAGGEGRVGMEAVNEVIHNRARMQKKSLYNIVMAPKQFSAMAIGADAAIKKAKNHKRWNEALNIVKSPLTDHTHGATYYHTIDINPYWGPKLIKRGYKTLTIGHHLFYYY